MGMRFSCAAKYRLGRVGLWRKVLIGGKLYLLGSRYTAVTEQWKHGGIEMLCYGFMFDVFAVDFISLQIGMHEHNFVVFEHVWATT